MPISEQRWKEKGLDRWENFDVACQYLTGVLTVFEYFSHPITRKNLVDTFNLIWEHWTELDVAMGEKAVKLAEHWAEYMSARYEMITSRAHDWVISHVETLRRPLLEALSRHRSVDINSEQMTLADRIHMLGEITAVADYTIMLPMHGYRGCEVPVRHPSRVSLEQRLKTYHQRVKQVSHGLEYFVIITEGDSNLHRTCLNQIEGQNRARRETRGEPLEPLPGEPWMENNLLKLREPRDNVRGYELVIYRLAHQQTDEEWASFTKKLESHIASFDNNDLKQHLKLHWLDGADLGIPDGDIQAARTSFNETDWHSLTEDIQIEHKVFLAIDDTSVASYMGNTYSAATDLVNAGDFTGFVLAVDARYDPKEGSSRPEESPGYHGQMRILGSLVWADLYAQHAAQNATLEDLWPLAIHHPSQVYVGPIVPLQVLAWKVQNGIRNAMSREMVEYVKRKIRR